MTVLSRLTPRLRDRRAQRDLADCQQLHCTILRAFGQTPHRAGAREQFGVLYRLELEPSATILVQSQVEPDWSRLPPGYLVSPAETKHIDNVYAALRTGDVLRFRLHANATKRLPRAPDENGTQRDGKRVDLRRERDQLDWLARKGGHGGFELVTAQSAPVPRVQAAHGPATHGWKEGQKLTFGAVRFDGELRISDAGLFRETLRHGIGSGKAYGFGLLSIAPV